MLRIVWEIKNFLLSFFTQRTLGARALVIQGDKILLVKHTYIPEWHTIGGGIEVGESGLQALKRELKEEVGITLTGLPSLFGFYYNIQGKRKDYVVVYVCTEFKQLHVTSHEILEAKWFPLTSPPLDTSPGTKRRIEEYLRHQQLSDHW